VFDELLQAVGDREPLARPNLVPASKQRECDLLGEEGIAARHLVDAQERRPREPLTDRFQDDPLDVVEGQRPDMEVVHALLRERRPDGEGIDVVIGSSNGRHQADRLVPQTPDDELQHASRRQIHPLPVVDGHDDGRGGRHRTDAPQDGQRDGPLVGAPAGTRRSQERHLQGRALRLGERRQALVQDGLDEVAEDGVRETRLGLDGAARERPVAALEGSRQSLLPNGRLPDAGITRQKQGARAGRDRVQEAMEDRELGLAPDDVTGQRRSPRRWTPGL